MTPLTKLDRLMRLWNKMTIMLTCLDMRAAQRCVKLQASGDRCQGLKSTLRSSRGHNPPDRVLKQWFAPSLLKARGHGRMLRNAAYYFKAREYGNLCAETAQIRAEPKIASIHKPRCRSFDGKSEQYSSSPSLTSSSQSPSPLSIPFLVAITAVIAVVAAQLIRTVPLSLPAAITGLRVFARPFNPSTSSSGTGPVAGASGVGQTGSPAIDSASSSLPPREVLNSTTMATKTPVYFLGHGGVSTSLAVQTSNAQIDADVISD
ncbi:hypothetical protein KEM54_003405 [Ascosphaera aggregata]|nr:hypothetical protein KEM54_003405 [Ascosphaera aggregata]